MKSVLAPSSSDAASSNTYRSRQSKRPETWMVSYSDLVTLLLCFFILFFNADDVNSQASDSNNILARIGLDFSIPPDATQKDVATPTPRRQVQESETTAVQDSMTATNLPANLITNLAQQNSISTSAYDGQLFLYFPKTAFFDKSATELNARGKAVVDMVGRILQPYSNDIYIEIQGYSDHTPVVVNSGRGFSSNIELSSLRALSVYRKFAGLGIPESALSISGYAHHRPLADHLPNTDNAEEWERRITFRVESRPR